jgi:hypothetical protein
LTNPSHHIVEHGESLVRPFLHIQRIKQINGSLKSKQPEDKQQHYCLATDTTVIANVTSVMEIRIVSLVRIISLISNLAS